MRCENSPLWFLTALFVSSCLFGLVCKIKRTRFKVMVVALFLIIGGLLDYSPILLPWSLDTSFLGASFMVVGYCIKQETKKPMISSKLIVLFITMLVLYLGLVYINGEINLSVRIYGKYAFISIFIAFIVGVIGSLLWMTVLSISCECCVIIFLGKIGAMSLTLLCTHKMVFRIVYIVMGDNINIWLEKLIAFVISLLFGFFFDSLTTKVKKGVFSRNEVKGTKCV